MFRTLFSGLFATLSISKAYAFQETDLQTLINQAYAESADLSGADLHGQTLQIKALHDSNLDGANLRGAILDIGEIDNCSFKGADLSGAKIRLQNGRNFRFENSILEATEIEVTGQVERLIFKGVFAPEIFLHGGEWQGTQFVDSVLPGSHMLDMHGFSTIEFFDSDLRNSLVGLSSVKHLRSRVGGSFIGSVLYPPEAAVDDQGAE